jgi:3-hydroxyacyl-CoA dehydrogenase/enoyl-CoA hydratase/3-hydroxybutyryl-CoA epimerase
MSIQSATASSYRDRAAEKPAAGNTIRHWRRLDDRHGICWLTIDQQGTTSNQLSAAVLEELDQLLADLATTPPRALIISSGKNNGFISGAAIGELSGTGEHAEIEVYLRRAHAIFARLAQLPCATIALLHGFCFGAGLELALACRYRIARDDTRLGLPEIRLGMHPGFGATLRLTRLLPAPAALNLMLSGRSVDAATALQMGLLDDVVPQRRLYTTAVNGVLHGLQPRRSATAALYNCAPVRMLLAWWMRGRLRLKASRHANPAAFALIELWQRYGGRRERLLRAEARSLARLVSANHAPATSLANRSVTRHLAVQ